MQAPMGHQPFQSVRMEPEAPRLTTNRAKPAGNAAGRWLEEATREKAEGAGINGD